MPANFEDELAWGKVFERNIAEIFAEKQWPGCAVIENPPKADADFTVSLDGVLVGFLEIKARRIGSLDYSDTMVVARKWELGRYARMFFQVPTLCVVLFTDNLGVFDLSTPPSRKEQVVRRDRGTTELHCFWEHSRMEWYPELVTEIEERSGRGTVE